MRWIFAFIVLLSILSCKKTDINTNHEYLFDSSKIVEGINGYVNSCDITFSKPNQKTFYRLVVQQGEYQDVTVKITHITSSGWLIKKFPPTYVIEQGSNVFLLYTGMEVLFSRKNDHLKNILEHYKKYLNDDILPNGDHNNKYVIGNYKTWEISLIEDSLYITKNVPDPFRPREIEQSVRFKNK